MTDILRFKRKELEDEFLDSLSEEQTEMFAQIMMNVSNEFDQLNRMYISKVAECEVLKTKLQNGENL